MSQWLDEQYMWMSVATLAGFVWILYRFGLPQDATPAGEAEPEDAEPVRAAGAQKGGRHGGGREAPAYRRASLKLPENEKGHERYWRSRPL